jgi:tetratricopeptide (TPR) repeat protein
MGIVYLAQQTALKRSVALKMMSGQGALTGDAADRFRREAEATAGLQHPNIVQIYEIGSIEGVPYFALEYVAGGSLDRDLAGKPQPPREAAAVVETLARAMQHAHERGIVHRDLKPANVLLAGEPAVSAVGARSTPKITDFGLAKQIETDNSQTRSGSILGTPSYMAPEQAEGRSHDIGPAADLHALGAILYEMLTGRPPFTGASILETLEQVRSREPVPPSRLQPRTPRDLETICLKCLEKDPRRRYASAGELADDLHRFLAGEPIRARPVGIIERAWRWCRRKPAIAGLLAALLLVTVGGFALVLWQLQRVQTERDVAEARRREAERNLSLALDINLSVGNLAEELRPLAGTRSETVARILASSRSNFERLLRETGETPQLLEGKARMLNSFSELYVRMGNSKAALASAEEARDLFRRLLDQEESASEEVRRHWRSGLAESLQRTGTVLLRIGRSSDAHVVLKESLALRQTLAHTDDGLERQRDLGDSLFALGDLHVRQGDWSRAHERLGQAVKLLDELAAKHPDERSVRLRLARAHEELGELYSATPSSDVWNLAGAEASFRQSRRLMDELHQLDPENAEYQERWVHAMECVGHMLMKQGKPEAKEHLEAALDRAERLVGQDPANFSRAWLRHRCAHALARLRQETDLKEALRRQNALLADLLPRLEAEMRKDPQNVYLKTSWLALANERTLALLALAKQKEKREENLQAAATILESALRHGEELIRQDPELYDATDRFWYTHLDRSELSKLRGDKPGTSSQRQASHALMVAFYQHKLKGEPDYALWSRGLQEAYTKSAMDFWFISGEHERAMAPLAKAAKILEDLRDREPKERRWLNLLGDLHELWANLLSSRIGEEKNEAKQQESRLEIARLLERRVEFQEKALKLAPDNPDQAEKLADALHSLYQQYQALWDMPRANAVLRRQLDALETFERLKPDWDPLASRDPLASGVQLKPTSITTVFALRNLLDLSESGPRYIPPPIREMESLAAYGDLSRIAEMLYRYVYLIEHMDPAKPADADQGRWALRRVLHLLHRLREKKELPKAWERYLASFAKKLKNWPADKQRPAADLADALDRLDYVGVVDRLMTANRMDELFELLLYEARSVATCNGLEGVVRALWLEAVLCEPRAAVAVLKKAAERLDREPAPGKMERDFLAEMARLRGDVALARRLDPAILERAPDVLMLNVQGAFKDSGQVRTNVLLQRAWKQTLGPQWRDTADTWRFMAFAELGAFELDAAEKAVAQVRAKAPDDPGTRVLVSYLALQRHQFREALTELEPMGKEPMGNWATACTTIRVLAHLGLGEPVDPDAEYLRAATQDATRVWVRVEQGKGVETAVAESRRKVQEKPRDAGWRFRLGAALVKAGKVEEALKLLEPLAEREGFQRDPTYWYYLGEARFQAGKKEQARQAWQKALELFPATGSPDAPRRQLIEKLLKKS